VDEGRVRVIAADGTSKTLGVGQVHRVSMRATVKGPSAADLVTRARARRHAGDIAGAIASYERLVEDFPRASAARTAMVTLGQLHLDAGRAKLALKWFDRYLASGGALAEDAHYGRIRALRALGRTAAEERAIASFLAEYPSGSYAERLRAR
jgi:tetratricopeptide (TPR) repeat protein